MSELKEGDIVRLATSDGQRQMTVMAVAPDRVTCGWYYLGHFHTQTFPRTLVVRVERRMTRRNSSTR